MPELRRSRPADIRYLVGTTGTGKTYALRKMLRAHRGRALVWDWKDDHHTMPTARTLADFARRALFERELRYRPDYDDVPRQFDLFCRMAWAVQEADPATDCLFVVEELAEVTTASAAPAWWRRIVIQGRVYGFTVVGTTQSPAFVDKAFTGSATFIRCGRLGEFAHADVIAQRIATNGDRRELAGAIQRLPDRAAYVFDGRKTTLERGK